MLYMAVTTFYSENRTIQTNWQMAEFFFYIKPGDI